MISLFLVEDERIARESIRDNVPWQEHDILFLGDAPDGEVALPQLLEKRPDILLTDIKMPFMDGLELARIVRKELPDTRIIILSGHNEFEYARKAITLGVNDYLLKPVSSRDILEAVDRSKAQILECRARRIERQSYSITQRELFFSNLYSGILMGPAQMLHQRIYDADICLRQSGDADGGRADRSVLFCAAAQRQAQKQLSGTVFCSAWEMVKGFDAGWTDFCPAKPCLPSSIYGILNRKNRETARHRRASVKQLILRMA